MSDIPNPTPASEPADQAPRPQQGPPQPGGPRPGPKTFPRASEGHRPPREEKPRNDGTAPTVLDRKDFSQSRPNKRMLDASIEAEMEAALAGLDFGKLDEQGSQKPAAKTPGGKKKGTIVSIHGTDVFIDVPGGRGQGLLPLDQFETRPQIGEVVEFSIERYDAANGLVLLTRQGSVQSVSDWSNISLNMIVLAKVTGMNKNKSGMMIEVSGVKGFLPLSQLDLYRVEDPEQFLNQQLKVQVVELDREERNLIVSRRAVQEREREDKREQLWATLQEGQTRVGVVRMIKPFGAFVDLDGADGLIPISELSWQRIGDPSEVVQIGQRVEVVVKRLDTATRRISLSLRQLLANPWDDFAKTCRPGSRVSGKVTRLEDFGAFVELAPGIEGLIHISELSTERVRRVRDVVTEGQHVEVQVMAVDTDKKRIGLSLKTIRAGEEAVAEAAGEAERLADAAEATARMANRSTNPNLRGGIGDGKPLFGDA